MADNKKVWQNILIGIVIFFGAINFILTVADGGKQNKKSTMSEVAGNLEEKYNMAASAKDYFNMCITAGSISDAYFMAKDEINYKKWFETVKKIVLPPASRMMMCLKVIKSNKMSIFL